MFRNPFRKLTPLEMLAKQLDDAKRHKVSYAAAKEETDAALQMLDARIARIESDIKAMTTHDKDQPQ